MHSRRSTTASRRAAAQRAARARRARSRNSRTRSRRRGCRYGRRTYRYGQTRRRGRTTYQCRNARWIRRVTRTCRFGRRNYRNGQTRRASRRRGRRTTTTTYQCRNGRWAVRRARHRRAQEYQCCKRTNCLTREVGYYCYKRSACAGATATHPHKGYCRCARGTHLAYVRRGRVTGYFCRKLSACSTNAAHPTATYCTCRAGYTKKHKRGRRVRTRIRSGHGYRYRYTMRGGGYYCVTRNDYCPTYNVRTLQHGSKKYNCRCRRGYTIHYYRYNNKFFKSCKRNVSKVNTCTHRARTSCLLARNCSYRFRNGRGVCSPCTRNCVPKRRTRRRTRPTTGRQPIRRHPVDPMPRNRIYGGRGGIRN